MYRSSPASITRTGVEAPSGRRTSRVPPLALWRVVTVSPVIRVTEWVPGGVGRLVAGAGLAPGSAGPPGAAARAEDPPVAARAVETTAASQAPRVRENVT